MRRCRVMVFEKPEVIDKTGRGANWHMTSHNAGTIDTANVACTSDILHATLPPLHLRQQVYDKLTKYCYYSLLCCIVQLLMH